MRAAAFTSQRGFTLIELIVVIVILGLLAVTAAPKFMNLTADANAGVVKTPSGAVKSASHMVYLKGRFNLTSANDLDKAHACISDECRGQKYEIGSAESPPKGWISITRYGHAVSASGSDYCLRTEGVEEDKPYCYNITIAGAIDFGVGWNDIPTMIKDDSSNKSDWYIHALSDGGMVFIPRSAPQKSKVPKNYLKSSSDVSGNCGVYYNSGVSAYDEKLSTNHFKTYATPIIKTFVQGC